MYACIYDFDFGNEQVNSLILLIDNVYIKIKLHSFNTPALYLWQKNNHYFQAHIINGKLIYTYRNNEKGYKKEERKCKLKQAKVKYILQKSLQKQDKKILCKINEKNNR